MKTVGLIVEYNPLHYGHLHHFKESLKATGADAAIAVMSGHFLQRGEPAIAGKWTRAEAALRMGADLVLELPVRYSSSPAEWFAYGAVSLLNATGVVDTLCFGSELGSLDPLSELAETLHQEPKVFRELLKAELKSGVNYPSAYSKAAQRFATVSGSDVAKPNNNLGLHYLMALRRTNSRILPFTVPRIKSEYHQTNITDSLIASATAIRKLLFEKGSLAAAHAFLPGFTLELLERDFLGGQGPVSWESLAGPLLYQLQTLTPEQLVSFDEVDEGLEYRLHKSLIQLKSGKFTVEKLLGSLKTKRYTRTKLQRMLLRILLKQPKDSFNRSRMSDGPAYIRVLGFNGTGRELLRRMKQTAQLPVITKVERAHSVLLEEDIRATSVYAMGFQNADLWHMQRDYYQPPIRI